jgi:hypothetical protein
MPLGADPRSLRLDETWIQLGYRLHGEQVPFDSFYNLS